MLVWYIAKRIPRGIALLLNFITIFLTIFLLIGCYNSSQDSTFLVRYQINSKSSFYGSIQSSFKESSSTVGLEKVKIRAGFMGICIDKVPTTYNLQGTQETQICYPRKNLTTTNLYRDLSIDLLTTSSNSSSASLNVLQLGELTSVNVIHPYLLMATIVLTIIMFLSLIYVIIPGLPGRNYLSLFLLLLSPTLVLISGMSAIWTHIGIHAAHKLVPAASMGMVSVYTGRKAASMMWFGFAFLMTICLILYGLKLKELRNGEDDTLVPDYNTNNSNNSKNSQPSYHNYYYSDSSSYGTKA
ncbi:similar to Saccharomyces cerevisiae YBR040W FIG1 Integral membrane protein required for efficient mating [Maudiozyma saulgeensis]|uniref:Similar to Saccharomyces cerevisiae YBR040W FIG1 Integral membrane protein required for efficient mating n=1 Tax=Maudiozyma saulgeensis TaxID=1789683 RepID=A0A1X7R7I4_9SACH|nr:similar to Saccharomyces cerevisiae YBR040W FIG1 Integral membrane protein required for efficient mating [Kazachstania saulgeensis]